MKTNGILMAISSLPSKEGIGDFYESAYEFIDILKEAKIKIWQLLPLNPAGYAASPYQSECGEALDPIYISLKFLKDNNYLKDFKEYKDYKNKRVDYDEVLKYKEPYFKEAFKNQKDTETKEFKDFVKNNSWVYDYALFHVLFLKNKYLDWSKWSEKEKNAAYNYNKFDDSKYKDEILYTEWLQFIVYKEYMLLKEYANKNGVLLMGDIPFYVGFNSSDCWANQDNFMLDDYGEPTHVAGVPPDYFAENGQRWGNPIYDWKFMKQDNYDFWMNRVLCCKKLYDILRIDHFRAFDTYYMIPSSCPTAKVGEWKVAPGDEFFTLLEKENIGLPIIAEDLGDLFPSVLKLRDDHKLAGMNVLEFTLLDKNIEILPNQVVYTGTHDNDTLAGWYNSLNDETKELLEIVMRYKKMSGDTVEDKIIRHAFASEAKYVIIPTQDYLNLPSYYRMNTPGTVGAPDWQFKLESFQLLKDKIPYIKELVETYKR